MKKLRIIIFIIAFIILNTTISNAVSLTIKASKTTANKGDSVKITVNGNGISGRVNLSVSGNGTLNKNSVWVENSSDTATLKINGTGNITVTANPNDISDSISGDAITSIRGTSTTIKVKSSSNDSSTNNTTKASSDATLSNLGIKPNDFNGFRKANTSYSVTVPKNVEKISIYATPSNSKATVAGTGSKTLKIGKNTFSIKVTAEDKKTTKTYTLNITRKSEDETTSDATLKDLGIRPKEYDFTGFKPTLTSYNVSVPNDVEKITIYATAKNAKDTITGSGAKTLNVGQNKCEIKVTSEDKKTTKTYIINVTRKEEKEEDKEDEKESEKEQNIVADGLKNIKVKDAELEPIFSQNVYSYNVNVPAGTKKLEIDTETTSKDIEVEIAGNEELKEGENIITVLVHNKQNDATATYQINAKVENQKIDLSTVNSELKDAESNAKIQAWIIKGTIIAIVVLIIIYLIQRYRITNEYEDEEYEENYEEENESQFENSNQESDESQYNDFDDEQYEEKTRSTSASEDLRNIGLFDTQRIEFEEYEQPKKHGKYKGKRFK